MVRKVTEFGLGLSISFILGWIVQQILIYTNIYPDSYIANVLVIIILSVLTYLFLRKRYVYIAKGVLVGTGLLILGILFTYKINSGRWG